VAEERARISRELHDLVAHSMGVIVIQAQGAQRALDTSPDQAREALSAIETAGRLGMAEMRRLLGLLADGGADAATAPQPTLREIPELVARLRATGMPVDLRVEGAVRALPTGVELTGYRIVQEALTNALKHAGRAQVDVRLRYEPNCVDIEVTDQGPTDSTQPINGHDSGSRGLTGMRERVSMYGGTLETGPRTGSGGFSVHARIPLEAKPA
jgi:signal transduction histidine kinase